MKYISIIILIVCFTYQGWSQGDTTITIQLGDMKLDLKVNQSWIESKSSVDTLKEIVVKDSDVNIKIDTSAKLRELIRLKNTKRAPEYKRTFNDDEAFKEGDIAAEKQLYEEAINYYFATEAFDPNKRAAVKTKVNKAFKEINDLKNDALVKEEIANLALVEAKKQTKIAIKEKLEADRQRKIAVIEKRRAEEQRKIAIEERRKAVAAQALAEKREKEAIAAKKEAERQECLAIEQTKIANVQRARAERLRIEALSKTIALKSSSMRYDNQDTVKALLALEAYNMQRTVNANQKTALSIDDLYRTSEHQDTCSFILSAYDSLLLVEGKPKRETAELLLEEEGKGLLSPEIYTGLHDALVKLKGADYDEVKLEDEGNKKKRSDIIRSIVQIHPKIFYTLGGGRLVKWDINDWNEVGKPSFDDIEVIQDRDEIDMGFAVLPGSQKEGDLITVGSKSRKIELISYEGNANFNFSFANVPLFKRNRKTVLKNPNYNFQQFSDRDLEGVFDMALDDKNIYLMSRYGRVQRFNTTDGKIETVKELYNKKVDGERRAEQIAISSNDQLMAIGYKDGRVDIFDMKNFGSVKYDLSFLTDTLKGKITELAFNEESGELAVGTEAGYIAILPKTDQGYSSDNVFIRDVQPASINAIDFQEVETEEGESTIIMAAACNDGTVSVWRMKEFNNALYEPFMFEDKNNAVAESSAATSLEFIKTPNNKNHNQLIVGYFDGTVKFWTLEIERLANELRCTSTKQLNGRTGLNEHEKIKYRTEVGLDIKDYTQCGEEN